jgi:hypothetical protein
VNKKKEEAEQTRNWEKRKGLKVYGGPSEASNDNNISVIEV